MYYYNIILYIGIHIILIRLIGYLAVNRQPYYVVFLCRTSAITMTACFCTLQRWIVDTQQWTRSTDMSYVYLDSADGGPCGCDVGCSVTEK